MKSLFKTFVILGALLLPVSAQQGDGYGFLNIANLVPGEDPCEITIGGEKVVNGGLKSGSYTGWFMVQNGSKTVSLTIGELDTASGSIEISEGNGNLIAIFLEPDTRTNSEGRPYPPKIRIKSFPTYGAKGFGLKFVSLCQGENRFQLGPLKLDPKRYDPIEIPKWNGGGFEIKRNGKSIGNIGGSSESGAFYALVGTDGDGEHAIALVNSDQQEVPEYLKKDKRDKPDPSETASEDPTQDP